MKQRALLFSLATGAACLALRLLQNHIGFEADTRLPVPGSLPALLLPLLLLLSAAALIFLTRRLPRSTEAPFSAQFGGADAKCLTLTVLGCFLVGLSGVWELLRAVSGGAGRSFGGWAFHGRLCRLRAPPAPSWAYCP